MRRIVRKRRHPAVVVLTMSIVLVGVVLTSDHSHAVHDSSSAGQSCSACSLASSPSDALPQPTVVASPDVSVTALPIEDPIGPRGPATGSCSSRAPPAFD